VQSEIFQYIQSYQKAIKRRSDRIAL